MNKEDIEWYARWAQVLVKVRNGSTSDTNTVLTRKECTDLLRGLRLLSHEAKEVALDG